MTEETNKSQEGAGKVPLSSGGPQAGEQDSWKMKCEEIQPLIFGYMSRELGTAQSGLVRGHLRKCQKCQSLAAEIQATLDVLHRAAESDTDLPKRLSEKHRARIVRALTHPVIHWIDSHHILVSVILAIVLIVFIAFTVRGMNFLRHFGEDVEVITVTIGRQQRAVTNAEPQPDKTADGQ